MANLSSVFIILMVTVTVLPPYSNAMIKDPCPKKGYAYSGFGKICLRISSDSKSWADAKKACESNGETLLVLETLERIIWLKTLRQHYPGWGLSSLWIGGKSTGGNWKWHGKLDNEPILLSDYIHGSPANKPSDDKCLQVLKHPDFTWKEDNCKTKKRYLCEKPAPVK